MSRLQQGNGDDYPEAAGKHMKDCNVLMAASRCDGAAYLAGYVVECALKTLIQLQTGKAEHSHDLRGLCEQLDELAVQVDARHGKVYLAAEAALRNVPAVLPYDERLATFRNLGEVAEPILLGGFYMELFERLRASLRRSKGRGR